MIHQMNQADMIIQSNAVFTGVKESPFPGWLSIRGNEIQCVQQGRIPQEIIGKNTKLFDYGNQLVMAGFIDSHVHFGFGMALKSRHYVDLSRSKSEQECIDLVRKHLVRYPDLDHVLGMGWFLSQWDNPKSPDRNSLDQAFPNTPVYLFSIDGHTAWLNTKALEECEILQPPALSFGSFGRNESGELNGLLYEIDALSFIMDRAYAVEPQHCNQARDEMFRCLAGCGVTSIGDLSASPRLSKIPDLYEKFLDAKRDGTLTARVHLYPSLGDQPTFTLAKKIRQLYRYDDLQLAGLKQFVDGTTSLYSGLLLEDYSDCPNEKGFSNYTQEKYETLITAANREGFSVRLHAIGDGAVRIALNAMEFSARNNDMGGIHNCIEHCENIHPADLSRFAEIGAFASIQPTHLPLDMDEKITRIGLERAQYEWPIKSLLKNNAPLCFGSDYPIFDLNPMHGLYAAVTRCLEDGTPTGANPQEKISLQEALVAYTAGSAESLGRKEELGTLEAGKKADVIVLDRNLFELHPKEYLKTKVILTIMDGKTVFSR